MCPEPQEGEIRPPEPLAFWVRGPASHNLSGAQSRTYTGSHVDCPSGTAWSLAVSHQGVHAAPSCQPAATAILWHGPRVVRSAEWFPLTVSAFPILGDIHHTSAAGFGAPGSLSMCLESRNPKASVGISQYGHSCCCFPAWHCPMDGQMDGWTQWF